jgi:general nucleoside transport system ATP-binding protein
MTASSALAARGITKVFPGGLIANDAVSLAALRGEVHALLGENGSGKTTLCKILTGLYRPDGGAIEVNGEAVRFSSPADAHAAGIFMVHQHFSLVESLTVAENVVLGWSRNPTWRFSPRKVEEDVAITSAEFGIAVDPRAYVWQLSAGERQRVEILKALYRGASTLILDEPTAVLTPQECAPLFDSLRRMAERGASIIFISHKLGEVVALCDRVTVLRQGRTVLTEELRGKRVDAGYLASKMVGHEILLSSRSTDKIEKQRKDIVLAVDGVTLCDEFGRKTLDSVSLNVRAGEIVGVAGVSGNGQRELAEVIAGLRPRLAGTVSIDKTLVPNGSPRTAIDLGIAYVPQDRHVGLALQLSVTENIVLKSHSGHTFRSGPFLRPTRMRARTDELLRTFDVRGRPDSLASELSGGNAQKVVLARELSSNPKVLVAETPTRGLDIGAIESVRRMLLAAAARGVAVLLLSEDLDEVMDLSDRIAVMYRGRIVGIVDTKNREKIGLMMAGGAS